MFQRFEIRLLSSTHDLIGPTRTLHSTLPSFVRRPCFFFSFFSFFFVLSTHARRQPRNPSCSVTRWGTPRSLAHKTRPVAWRTHAHVLVCTSIGLWVRC